MGFDYGKIAKESFAWYNNKEFWMWGIGFGIISFVLSALNTASLVMATTVGIAAFVFYLITLLVLLLAGSFFGAKILSFALKRRKIDSNEINVNSVLRYVGLGIVGIFYYFFSLKRLFYMILPLAGIVLSIAVLFVMSANITSSTLASVIMSKMSLAALLITGIMAITWLPVILYNAARLLFSCVFFWTKKGCGIIEAIDSSWNATDGKALNVFLVWLVLGILDVVAMIVGGLLSFIPLIGVLFNIALYPVIGGIGVYGLVETYSQLTGAEEKKEATPAKKEEKSKKKR